MTKGRAGGIRSDKQIIRPLFLQDVEQIAGEAEDGRDGLPLGAGHLGQRMEELIDPGEQIDHPD